MLTEHTLVFIAAIILTMLAICACLAAVHRTFKVLGLEFMQTLVWLGLAEVPAPQTRRRTRPTAVRA